MQTLCWGKDHWRLGGCNTAPQVMSMARPPSVKARGDALTTWHHRACCQRCSICQPHGAAFAVVQRQRSPPNTLPATSNAARWRQSRQQPLTGSAAPAQRRTTKAAGPLGPGSIRRLDRKYIGTRSKRFFSRLPLSPTELVTVDRGSRYVKNLWRFYVVRRES